MRRASPAVACVFGVLLLADAPALSPAPAFGPAAPLSDMERLKAVLSTSNNPLEGCAKRSRDCTFKPCCDDRTCRQNGDGENLCR